MQFEELDLEPPNIDEILNNLNDAENRNLEEIANDINKINLQELADILEASTFTITKEHAGMITHSVNHPKIGKATTIQASGDGALLIKHLL